MKILARQSEAARSEKRSEQKLRWYSDGLLTLALCTVPLFAFVYTLRFCLSYYYTYTSGLLINVQTLHFPGVEMNTLYHFECEKTKTINIKTVQMKMCTETETTKTMLQMKTNECIPSPHVHTVRHAGKMNQSTWMNWIFATQRNGSWNVFANKTARSIAVRVNLHLWPVDR